MMRLQGVGWIVNVGVCGPVDAEPTDLDSFGSREYTLYCLVHEIYALGNHRDAEMIPTRPPTSRSTWSRNKDVRIGFFQGRQACHLTWSLSTIALDYSMATAFATRQLDCAAWPRSRR